MGKHKGHLLLFIYDPAHPFRKSEKSSSHVFLFVLKSTSKGKLQLKDSKIIPNYAKKVLFTDFGIMSNIEELIIQLEIAIGMEDGKYKDKIPALVGVLRMRFSELHSYLDKEKIGYIT